MFTQNLKKWLGGVKTHCLVLTQFQFACWLAYVYDKRLCDDLCGRIFLVLNPTSVNIRFKPFDEVYMLKRFNSTSIDDYVIITINGISFAHV